MSDEWKRRVIPKGGTIPATFKSHERLMRDLRSRNPLRNATITEGGLTVKGGGDLRVEGLTGSLVRFSNGRMYLAYNPDDIVGSIAAGLASDGVSSAMWLMPPSVLPPVSGNENCIILQGRSSSSAGGLWLLTVGRATLGSGEEHVQIQSGLNTYVNAGGSISLTASSGVFINGGTGGAVSIAAGAGHQLQLNAGNGVYLRAATTSGTANASISGSGDSMGLLTRVSSSRRYKDDIVDHAVDVDAVLSIRPRSWRDKGEVSRNPDTTNRYAGAIAEEVDELGLSEFVVYGEDGTPESVAYDRLAIGLLDVVRMQREQIAWLVEQVTALSGQGMPDFRPTPTPGVRATPEWPAPSTTDEETS